MSSELCKFCILRDLESRKNPTALILIMSREGEKNNNTSNFQSRFFFFSQTLKRTLGVKRWIFLRFLTLCFHLRFNIESTATALKSAFRASSSATVKTSFSFPQKTNNPQNVDVYFIIKTWIILHIVCNIYII